MPAFYRTSGRSSDARNGPILRRLFPFGLGKIDRLAMLSAKSAGIKNRSVLVSKAQRASVRKIQRRPADHRRVGRERMDKWRALRHEKAGFAAEPVVCLTRHIAAKKVE
jgi:hypothetical protein